MKDRTWLYLGILTFVTALAWGVITTSASLHKKTIGSEVLSDVKPLNPTIDQSVFDSLSKRTPIVTKGGQP